MSKKLEDKVFEMKYKGNDIFWYEADSKITILTSQLGIYLRKEGYRLFDSEPVRLIDNVAYKTTPNEIFQYTLNYIRTFKETTLEEAFTKQGEVILIKNKAVLLGLPECNEDFLNDSENVSYHIYKNGVLKVEKEKEFKLIPFKDIKKFIWNDSILDREFKMFVDNDEVIQKAMFYKFLENITNNDKHFQSLSTAIGYLLHKYKDQRNPKCIIVNDENLVDDGSPEGGTGKGLVVKAISQIVEKAMYNGKNSDFSKNRFAFQNVKNTTDILVIDDINRNFNLETLFSVLSDDMPVERKNKDVQIIPYEDSPKFVLTTNYTVKGSSSSYKRRRFDVFLNNYYNAHRTPADEFKCEFFHGWDKEEWQRFDFLMMTCLRKYLSTGLKVYESEEIKVKMLKNETSADFWELMLEEYSNINERYYKNDLKQELIILDGKKYEYLNYNHRILKSWLNRYAEHHGLNVKHDKDMKGGYFEFIGENIENKSIKQADF